MTGGFFARFPVARPYRVIRGPTQVWDLSHRHRFPALHGLLVGAL